MAVNLINSTDIEVVQDGQDISLELVNSIPVVDNSVSTSSTNAIENQAITNYVDGEITTLKSNLFKIQIENISIGTLAGYGGEKYGQQTSYTLPNGYKCLGMTGFQLTGIGFTDVLISQIDADNNYIYWSARKEGANDAVDIMLAVKLLLVKEDFV